MQGSARKRFRDGNKVLPAEVKSQLLKYCVSPINAACTCFPWRKDERTQFMLSEDGSYKRACHNGMCEISGWSTHDFRKHFADKVPLFRCYLGNLDEYYYSLSESFKIAHEFHLFNLTMNSMLKISFNDCIMLVD